LLPALVETAMDTIDEEDDDVDGDDSVGTLNWGGCRAVGAVLRLASASASRMLIRLRTGTDVDRLLGTLGICEAAVVDELPAEEASCVGEPWEPLPAVIPLAKV
jgi:hypothetical protein